MQYVNEAVVICSGGPKEEVVDFKQLPLLKDEIIFIGADRGAIHLLENGIIPNEIIGDFDSLSEEEFHYLKQKVQNNQNYRRKKMKQIHILRYSSINL